MFTPDATRLLVVGGDVVAVLDAASRAEQQRLSIPAVMAAALSPQGTYMVTFQRPTKNDSGAGGCGAGAAESRGARQQRSDAAGSSNPL